MHVGVSGKFIEVDLFEEMAGRVIDTTGKMLYEESEEKPTATSPLFCVTPAIMTIDSVTRPLNTGLAVIDSITPIGRGQRQLILGNRQSGKTQIAVDTIINQHDQNVHCIYVAIGLKQLISQKLLKLFEIMEQWNILRLLQLQPVIPLPRNI